jgi:deoxyadenosine/deoxycytidine kinase
MKIAVGGMIASGKSTLVKHLAKEFDCQTLDEFDKDDEVFNTLLKWLYEGKPDVEMLLQIYFLHKHWQAQRNITADLIVDRHIIEHWLFAQKNLVRMPEVLNMYNGLFHQYMGSVIHPDLYVILDMDWETFKERIMKRGRTQEIENFGENEDYFQYLMSDYIDKLRAQCQIYDIPYLIIDTSNLTEEQVNLYVIKAIKLLMSEEKSAREEMQNESNIH